MSILSPYATLDEIGNGRQRLETTIHPRYYSKDGIYLPIGNQISALGDQAFGWGVDELLQFRFRPSLAGNAPVLRIGKGEDQITFTPLGTNNVTGRITGSLVRYLEAWNNADLEFKVDGQRFGKNIYLRSGHPRSFAFRVNSRIDTGLLRVIHPFLSRDDVVIPLEWVIAKQNGKETWTINLPAGDWSGWVLDPTVTLQPDASAGKDTRINSGNPTVNYGIAIAINNAANTRGLIGFDLSAIPSNATCNSCTFYVYQVTSTAGGAFSVQVHSIASGNAAWIEGTKNGALAGAGEPCWNALAANGSGGVTTAWAGSVGLGTSGTDYEATALGTLAGNSNDANGTEYSTLLTASRVQGWFGAVNTNYGLRIANALVGGFGSSDNATAGRRPKLVVDYSLPSTGLRGIITGGVIGSFRSIQTGGKH
jgi:hypothetical protein